MDRRRFFTGSRFEERGGYARGVRAGDMVFLSGCTGFDYQSGTIDEDVVAQTRKAFENIHRALQELGSSFDDAVRVVIYIADRSYYEATVDVIGDYCRAVRPANTFIVAQLVDPRMKIEIEVTTRDGARRQGFWPQRTGGGA